MTTNKTMKCMNEEMKYWSKVALGATIIVCTYLPSKCIKAYEENKQKKSTVSEPQQLNE